MENSGCCWVRLLSLPELEFEFVGLTGFLVGLSVGLGAFLDLVPVVTAVAWGEDEDFLMSA